MAGGTELLASVVALVALGLRRARRRLRLLERRVRAKCLVDPLGDLAQLLLGLVPPRVAAEAVDVRRAEQRVGGRRALGLGRRLQRRRVGGGSGGLEDRGARCGRRRCRERVGAWWWQRHALRRRARSRAGEELPLGCGAGLK